MTDKKLIDTEHTEWKQWKIIGSEFISYYGGDAQIISNETWKFRIWEHPDDVGELINILNGYERKIERLETLNEHKREEINARIKVLNEVCNKYLNKEIMFKNDVDPNDAVQQVVKEILNTNFEFSVKL